MFTGLVDAIGTIATVTETEAGRELRVAAPYADLVAGESIALNGACLTVRTFGAGWFTVAAVETTLDRTTIGSWTTGRRVNLERALKVGDRLGGHLVQGHVDGVGRVIGTAADESAWLIDVEVPPDIAPLLVPHGSVTIDGVSMTVNALPASDVFQASVIAYTRQHTTLGDLRQGDVVHLEGDIIGKYVRRLVEPYRSP